MTFGPAEGTRFFNRKPPMAWPWQIAGALSSPAHKEEIRRFSGVVLAQRS